MSLSPAARRMEPPDQPARDKIEHALEETLFVEAGAGSGKTTALVRRVVALVKSGVELRHIAAITFTEKAGAELRDRVRQELQKVAAAPDASPEVASACLQALGQLDGAAIGTLHSFAQRILSEHPVEAQLPPRVEVLDEVTSGVQFQRRWDRTLDQLLADPSLERTLLLLHAAGAEPRKLRALALAFDASWDLVEDRVPADCPDAPSLAELLEPVHEMIRSLDAMSPLCSDPADKLVGIIGGIVAFGKRLRAAGDDDLDLLEVLMWHQPKYTATYGVAKAWNGRKPEVAEQVTAVAEHVQSVRRDLLGACLAHLGSAMRHHTLESAHARRRDGRLEFHDLLVLARKVLRDPVQGPVVRDALHRRYHRLLLDEFQDTDPIQIELAVRIAAADPATADQPHWADVDVAAGRLFVVGDPKQSIYRFRRADISTFLRAKERFAPEAGGAVELTANFRTGEPIIEWVNTVFDALMSASPDVDVPVPSQPAYVGLQAQRPPAPGGPPVAVLGAAAPTGGKADDIRRAEAVNVAHAVTVAMRECWQVREGEDGWRDAKLGDITVLVPARTSLPFLEDALQAAGVPFRAESSSIVYATRAVRDLMMVLRAADDPTDHHRIVSALRTPLLGCGDDDLYRHKVLDRRSWAYNGPTPPDAADGVVAAGLAFLRSVHEARHWQSPAELLDRIARDRRALELGFAEGRPRDVWRRLRFVIDQARAWSEATGGSLRAYLHWVDQQTLEGVRVSESVLPETDDDAVRIMTIHAAKGLEFPITIVSGLSTGAQGATNAVDVVFPPDGGPVGYRVGGDVVSQEFVDWKPIDDQMGYDERIRLLYVACTRACDHLVVSLHRPVRKSEPNKMSSRCNAELLLLGMGLSIAGLPDLSGTAEPLPTDAVRRPTPPPPYAAWAEARDAALALAARPGAVAATALTDDGAPDSGSDREPAPAPNIAAAPERPASLFDTLDTLDAVAATGAIHVGLRNELDGPPGDPDPALRKRPRDLDLPPWLKGRYGTAVGRAVHGVLQTIDLATGAGLDDAVGAQCQAEAVPERAEDVRRLVQDALGSPVVQAAAVSPHWREIYACTPIGDRLLEGYVDLLYRSAEGLVVVDHKTSASSDSAELDRRVQGYRLQGAAYAVAVGQATGEAVTRVVFLFLTPSGAVERELTDLPAAMADVERLVAEGHELVTQ